jgi:hypothetical protein
LYAATGAALRVVAPDGQVVTARLSGLKAAAVLGLAHVNDERGEELFLQTSQISSGANAVAYGLENGRLIPAGVTLSYGGDSASRAWALAARWELTGGSSSARSSRSARASTAGGSRPT